MMISMRVNEEEATLMKSYAQVKGMTLSDLVRKCVLEHIEDEIDLKAFRAAKEDFAANPQTFSLEEVEKELGLL